MSKALPNAARRLLATTGLLGPYDRWRERRTAAALPQPPPDGRPMPPVKLIVLADGPAGADGFSAAGRADADRIQDLAVRHGLDLGHGAAVLDFGCGAGRLARWLAVDVEAGGGRFQGCDLDHQLVAWCASHLPGRYAAAGLTPPLTLPAGEFDLVYAQTATTRLAEPTARAWLAELARVLKPGALAILAFRDEDDADRWAPPDVRARLEHHPYVTAPGAPEGSHGFAAWTTRAHVVRLAAAAFEPLEVLPGGGGAARPALAVLRARTPS